MVNKLEKLCIDKVGAEYCCLPEVKEKCLQKCLVECGKKFLEYDEKVIKLIKILQKKFFDKLSLSFPENFFPKHLIPFIVCDMVKWMKDNNECFGLSSSYSICFVKSSLFSQKGRLDTSLVARELVRDKTLDIIKRMVVAIGYFLTEDIRELCRELTEGDKYLISSGNFIIKYNFRRDFWDNLPWKNLTYLAVKNESEWSEEDLLDACECTLKGKLETAFKSSWMRLTSSYKNNVLPKFVKLTYDRFFFYDGYNFVNIFELNKSMLEIFSCLVYDVNEEALKVIFLQESLRWKNFKVLNILLFWPDHDLFMKIINIVWEIITDIEFFRLLHSVVDKINDNILCDIHDYRFILKEIWYLASSDYRKFVFDIETGKNLKLYETATIDSQILRFIQFFYLNGDDSPDTFLFPRLFNINEIDKYRDSLFLTEIVKDIPECQKKEILNFQGTFICEEALMSGRPWLADLFIELFVEKELIIEYKRRFFTQSGNNILNILRSSGEQESVDDINK